MRHSKGHLQNLIIHLRKVQFMKGFNSKIFWLSLVILMQFACHTSQSSSAKNKVSDVEPHRPNFHFSPPANWMNDPNGMVYFEGEYHLFYQYYPEATVWGPMHWGHAVSKDLVHWEHLPIALYPDALGLIFSGSTVVDWHNASGFGVNGKPPLVAIFTQHLMEGEKSGRTDFQYQSVAYSNDRGRTWTMYKGNPVIPNTEKIKDFRDPKVVWDESSKQWIMVFAAQDHVKFWGSRDLKNWKFLSNFGKEWGTHGGVWECPDLFPIQVEGTSEKKWVLLQSLNPGGPNGGSGTQYFVGNFDGSKFQLDPEFAKNVEHGKAVWLDWGRDNYAGVTWSDVPKADGRRIFMGWMSNWDYAMVVPTEKWRSAMTLPRSLELHKSGNAYRIHSVPVKELAALRASKKTIPSQTLEGELDLSKLLKINAKGVELELEIDILNSSKPEIAVVLSNTKNEFYEVGFDAAKNEFYSDRTKSGPLAFSDKFASKRHLAKRTGTSKSLKLHLFFDVASCELFADEGEMALTDIFFPTEDFQQIKLRVSKGKINLNSGTAYPLK